MDRLGKDLILREIRRISRQYKLSSLIGIAPVVVDCFLVAYVFSLEQILEIIPSEAFWEAYLYRIGCG